MAARFERLVDPARWVVASPRGPITTPAGPVWFTTDDEGPDEAAVVDTLASINQLIDQTSAEHGLPRSAVVVGGSSQGGAVALALGLRAPGDAGPLGGLFCVSGWLPHFDAVDYDLAGLAAAATPCLIVHGDDDEVVIVQQGRSGARMLERHGVPVTYVELPGGHHLGAAADSRVASWLEQLSL
jgi:phospholipase/carboxylesterase